MIYAALTIAFLVAVVIMLVHALISLRGQRDLYKAMFDDAVNQRDDALRKLHDQQDRSSRVPWPPQGWVRMAEGDWQPQQKEK